MKKRNTANETGFGNATTRATDKRKQIKPSQKFRETKTEKTRKAIKIVIIARKIKNYTKMESSRSSDRGTTFPIFHALALKNSREDWKSEKVFLFPRKSRTLKLFFQAELMQTTKSSRQQAHFLLLHGVERVYTVFVCMMFLKKL